MADVNLVHNTFVLRRTFPHSPQKVFSAFSDPRSKIRWYARSGAHEVVSYELDFSPGGREVLVGRMGPQTPVAGAVLTWTQTFAQIVEDQRIIFTQTVDVGDTRISCAVITLEFDAASDGCSLALTHQAVFIGAADGPQMRELGWKVLLDALSSDLE